MHIAEEGFRNPLLANSIKAFLRQVLEKAGEGFSRSDAEEGYPMPNTGERKQNNGGMREGNSRSNCSSNKPNIKEGEQIIFDLLIPRDEVEIVIASDMVASQKDAETTDADEDRENLSENFQ